MTSLITKFVFQKILGENASNNQGREDPYFETVPTSRLTSSKPKNGRRQRKALPPGLTPEEERTLVKVKRRAYRLDMAFGDCCGMKIGWSSIIAIVPAIGDVLDMLLAMMVIRTASEVGLPVSVKVEMILNVAFDFVIGLVPFLGDILDIAFKANTRNAIVLESYLRERGAENIRRQGLPPQQDPSLGAVFDEQQQQQQQVVTEQPIAQPPPSYGGVGAGGRGWFSARRVDDVEAQRPSGSAAPLRGGEGRREGSQEGKREGSHARREEGHGGKHKSSKHGRSKRESSRGRSGRTGPQESGVTKGGR
ncbi:hypothetical protein Q9L58_004119 [Maublancomyces gigas]|uniref:PH domain-containing protein n=1 Tax=Discina gigas TaxID=1032678 RepID=A0ABR3GM96_9PEZI